MPRGIPIKDTVRDLRTSRDTLQFMKDPIIETWVSTIRADRTKYSYAYQLMQLLKKLGMTPSEFKEWMRKDPTEAGIRIDGILSSYHSTSSAGVATRALLKFVKLYRIKDLTITVKISARRSRSKKIFTWEMAEKIIEQTIAPYRGMLTCMLWAAMSEHEFVLLNDNHPDIAKLNGGDVHAAIREQIKNDKSYVSIDFPPRKTSIDVCTKLIPKIYMPDLPIKTILYRNRGGMGITTKAIQNVWNRAALKAKIYWPGMGPHHLRVAFRSKCEELGIPMMAELMMGRGLDKYGYSRVDENFIINGPNGSGAGLKKLWESSPVVDRQTISADLEKRDKKMATLEKQADTRDKEIKDLRIEIKRMQIREIEKKLRIDSGTTLGEMEVPYPDDPTNEREQEEYDQLMKDRQDYKKEEHERLARLKKELARLESS